jgi:hypothetical protein
METRPWRLRTLRASSTGYGVSRVRGAWGMGYGVWGMGQPVYSILQHYGAWGMGYGASGAWDIQSMGWSMEWMLRTLRASSMGCWVWSIQSMRSMRCLEHGADTPCVEHGVWNIQSMGWNMEIPTLDGASGVWSMEYGTSRAWGGHGVDALYSARSQRAWKRGSTARQAARVDGTPSGACGRHAKRRVWTARQAARVDGTPSGACGRHAKRRVLTARQAARVDGTPSGAC